MFEGGLIRHIGLGEQLTTTHARLSHKKVWPRTQGYDEGAGQLKINVEKENNIFLVSINNEIYNAKSVAVVGASAKRLYVTETNDMAKKNYCTADIADSTMKEAEYLSRIIKDRKDKRNQEQRQQHLVEFISAHGMENLEYLTLKNNDSNQKFNIARWAVFGIGHIPNNRFIKCDRKLDENTFIIVDKR